MRRALNENPMFQVIFIAVLALIAGFLLLTRVMGGSSSTAETESATTTPGATAMATDPAAAAATDPAAAAVPADPAAAAPADGTASGIPASAFAPGPGLPAPVVKAYADGQTVALVVTKHRGIDDAKMREATDTLHGRVDTAVFETNAHHVADYSRIASGVNLDRVPALIVLTPRDVSGDAAPTATVSYGYRSVQSTVQALDDAEYDGKEFGYDPR
jgi:hypothetical protein